MKSLILSALLVGGQAADIAITCHGLHTGLYREVNARLVGTSCAQISLRKAALTAGTLGAYVYITKRGRKKLAVALIMIPTATGWTAAAVNARLIWGGQ